MLIMNNFDYILYQHRALRTEYLKTIFDHVEGCASFHEPDPVGNGHAMRLFARDQVELMRALAQKKASIIADVTKGGQFYVETNHLFIEALWLVRPEFGCRKKKMGVIFLKRDPKRIASSTLRVGGSPLTRLGRDWITFFPRSNPSGALPKLFLSSAGAIRSAIISLNVSSASTNAASAVQFRKRHSRSCRRGFRKYERDSVMWYVRETFALGEAFKGRFPAIKYYETAVDELNDYENVERILNYFGCLSHCRRPPLEFRRIRTPRRHGIDITRECLRMTEVGWKSDESESRWDNPPRTSPQSAA